MAVIAKNISFSQEMKENIKNGVQNSTAIASSLTKTQPEEVDAAIKTNVAQIQPIERSELKPSTLQAQSQVQTQQKAETTPITTSTAAGEKEEKKKRVLIGIYVTPEEQAELRQMFCSNGFSLSNAYRSAMTYLRQDIEQGKAFITKNSEILRK